MSYLLQAYINDCPHKNVKPFKNSCVCQTMLDYIPQHKFLSLLFIQSTNSNSLQTPGPNSTTHQVLNDAPLLPEDADQKAMPLMMESPQCVFFGTFMIWFASITINLGPTFLSGALAANIDEVSICVSFYKVIILLYKCTLQCFCIL